MDLELLSTDVHFLTQYRSLGFLIHVYENVVTGDHYTSLAPIACSLGPRDLCF
jgi:hypothetical protein